MSKRYQPSTNNNSFSGVLPDIVANFKTAMCNPYDKPKVITNRSKTPVPKISTNGKSVVPASTGLPAGLFGQQAKLANFKIPKLKRSTCNSTSKSTASSTTQSRNSSVSYKTPSKLLTAKSSRKPTTYLPKVRQRVSQQSKRTHHTATTNPKRNVPTTKFEFSIAATTTVTTKKPQHVHQRQGPWPYGIPPCSRYEIKWGDPSYTGSYVEGEWCYDVVGAAPRPMAWPDMSDMFPDTPKGIFELRSVKPCPVPSELSSIEDKPDSRTEYQEAPHASDTNNVQSRKPASCNAVRDSTSSITGPPVSIRAKILGKDISLAAPPYCTKVSAVTQTTTVCDQAKVTSFQSEGVSLVKSAVKARDIKRCDNVPYDRNLYKLFSSYQSTGYVHVRGIKRSADDCVESSFAKKARTERQD